MPPSAAIGKALAIAAGAPAASITTSKPRPPVASATCSASDPAVGSIARLAPISSPSARRCACGSISVTEPPIVAAAIAQSRPIGPPPITATSSLASIPPAATAAL